MPNPYRDEWIHGPDADPDPEVAEAIALVTEYQLGMMSESESAAFEHRLETDARFAEIVEPVLFTARAMRKERPAEASGKVVPLHPKRPWLRRSIESYATPWRIAAALFAVLVLDQGASVAYGAIVRSRIHPASVTFVKAPLPVVMAELRRRYHVDVQMCDEGVTDDRVTLTIQDAPIGDVADSIQVQTKRLAHWYTPFWHWTRPQILLFQPLPNFSKGFWYVFAHQLLRSYTTDGCHR